MRWRYFWPLLAVNVAMDAEIVVHTVLPTPAAIGGLIGIFAGSVAVWSLPYWKPRRPSHDSRSGAVWWTLRHPRRRWWMWRHGWSLAHQYEAEKRAEWHQVKIHAIGAELQRPSWPSSVVMDASPKKQRHLSRDDQEIYEGIRILENLARAAMSAQSERLASDLSRGVSKPMAEKGIGPDGFFDLDKEWIHHRVRMHVPAYAEPGWRVLDGSVGRVWGMTENLRGEVILRVLLADHVTVNMPVVYCVRVD